MDRCSASRMSFFDCSPWTLTGTIVVRRDGKRLSIMFSTSCNAAPEGEGWFFKLKIKNKSEMDDLMTKEEYEKFAKDNIC